MAGRATWAKLASCDAAGTAKLKGAASTTTLDTIGAYHTTVCILLAHLTRRYLKHSRSWISPTYCQFPTVLAAQAGSLEPTCLEETRSLTTMQSHRQPGHGRIHGPRWYWQFLPGLPIRRVCLPSGRDAREGKELMVYAQQ